MAQLISRVLLVLSLVLLTTGSARADAARISLHGIDGGSLSGSILPDSAFGITALFGDLSLRLAPDFGVAGEPITVRGVTLVPWKGNPPSTIALPNFGNCYAPPSQFHLLEAMFPDEALDLVGETNLLGYNLTLIADADALPPAPLFPPACVWLFKREAGQGSPVADPLQANSFILTSAFFVADQYRVLQMIGTVTFP